MGAMDPSYLPTGAGSADDAVVGVAAFRVYFCRASGGSSRRAPMEAAPCCNLQMGIKS